MYCNFPFNHRPADEYVIMGEFNEDICVHLTNTSLWPIRTIYEEEKAIR